MSSMFATPKLPAVPLPPAVPTVDDARQRQNQDAILQSRKGRASTILTGSKGLTDPAPVGTKTLLGM